MATAQVISADEYGRTLKKMRNDSQNVFVYILVTLTRSPSLFCRYHHQH